MNTRGSWPELSSVACVLMVGMLLAMWAQRSSPGCAWPPEAPRRLVLSRDTDREHLATDLAAADRIAQRYAASASAPGDDPHRRFADCDATLTQQIATLHDVSPDQPHAR